MTKERLILQLEKIFNRISVIIDDIDEKSDTGVLIDQDLILDFSLLSNKHIPPELCSEIKLFERIDEANDLLEKFEALEKGH